MKVVVFSNKERGVGSVRRAGFRVCGALLLCVFSGASGPQAPRASAASRNPIAATGRDRQELCRRSGIVRSSSFRCLHIESAEFFGHTSGRVLHIVRERPSLCERRSLFLENSFPTNTRTASSLWTNQIRRKATIGIQATPRILHRTEHFILFSTTPRPKVGSESCFVSTTEW